MIDRDNLPDWVKGERLDAEEMNALKRLAGRDFIGPEMTTDSLATIQADRIPFHLNRYLLLEDLPACGSASAWWVRLRDEGCGICEWDVIDTVTIYDSHGVVAASALAVTGGSPSISGEDGCDGRTSTGKYIPSGNWAVGSWWNDTRRHEPLVFGECDCDSSSSSSSSSSGGSSSSSGGSSSSSGEEQSSSSSSSSSGEECVNVATLPDLPGGLVAGDEAVVIRDGCWYKTPYVDCEDSSSSGA